MWIYGSIMKYCYEHGVLDDDYDDCPLCIYETTNLLYCVVGMIIIVIGLFTYSISLWQSNYTMAVKQYVGAKNE